ncbi:hypothetical protein SAY86_032221 [Trapa natans]|uniref:Uncharacterized protein n=1 Tax=Trapa natans TaxID=22666 RepID=A0AAN7RAG8_TRANT|nr:hypothetical protein SAY86_032221 [Trapa natans]
MQSQVHHYKLTASYSSRKMEGSHQPGNNQEIHLHKTGIIQSYKIRANIIRIQLKSNMQFDFSCSGKEYHIYIYISMTQHPKTIHQSFSTICFLSIARQFQASYQENKS